MVSDIKRAAGEIPSSGEPSPLFWVHHWTWDLGGALAQPPVYAVLGMQLATATSEDRHHFELLLMGNDLFLQDGCASDYYVCLGAACTVRGCDRAVPQ